MPAVAEPYARQLLTVVRRINRHPQLVGTARRIRERALGDEQSADRLSIAHAHPASLALAELEAIRSDAPGVLGEVGLTALQAWQRLAERQGRGRGEVDVTILFSDLVGFSSWALEAGDERAIELLRAVSEQTEPPIRTHKGEVVKRLGDGLMAAFPDAAGAVQAAGAACERIGSIEIDGYRPRLRTGIHLGRPRRIGRDYFGVDVNIAARLAEAAGPDEMLVSDRTLQSLDVDARSVESMRRRKLTAKGVPDDLVAHVLRMPASSPTS